MDILGIECIWNASNYDQLPYISSESNLLKCERLRQSIPLSTKGIVELKCLLDREHFWSKRKI